MKSNSQKNLATSEELHVSDSEYRIALLKERIYASIALLAVLVSIDTKHTTPLHADLIVGGTALSLWVASIVASRMSRRIILGHNKETQDEYQYRLSKHTPLLTTAAFPVFMIALSAFNIISLTTAVLLGIAELFLFIIIMSFRSARAIHYETLPTVLIAVLEISIGIAIVWLKLFVSH